MADTTLAKIVRHLQDEYLKTGANDPVAWKPFAAKLDITEEEIRAAIHEAFTVGK